MLRLQNTGGPYSPRQGWYCITLSHFQVASAMTTDLQSETITFQCQALPALHSCSGSGLKAACPYTLSSFIVQCITFPEQPLLSTLFSGLHNCFISSSKIEMVTVIQLFTQSSSCVDLPRCAASAGQQITQRTTWPMPGSESNLRDKNNLWLRQFHSSTSLNSFSTFFPQ